MNMIFSGRSMRDGLIYDYAGIWSRANGQIVWKAIVRNAAEVCRPCGKIDVELADDDILGVIAERIEGAITERLAHRPSRLTSPSERSLQPITALLRA